MRDFERTQQLALVVFNTAFKSGVLNSDFLKGNGDNEESLRKKINALGLAVMANYESQFTDKGLFLSVFNDYSSFVTFKANLINIVI